MVSLHQRVKTFENFAFSFNAEGAYSLFRHEAAGCATKVQSYNCKIDNHQDLSYVAALGVEAHGHSVVFAGGDAYLDGALMEKGPKGTNVVPQGEGTKGIVLVPYTPGVNSRAPAMGEFGPGVSGYHLSFGEVKLNVTLTQTETDSPNGLSFTNVVVMPSARCTGKGASGLCSKRAWATLPASTPDDAKAVAAAMGKGAAKGEHATSLAAMQPSRPQGGSGDGPHVLDTYPELRMTGEIIGRLKAIAEKGGICEAAKSAEQRQQQQQEARLKKQQQEAASPRTKQLTAAEEAEALWKVKAETGRLAGNSPSEAQHGLEGLQSKGKVFEEKLSAAGGRADATEATMKAMGIGTSADEQQQAPPATVHTRAVKAPSNSTLPVVKSIISPKEEEAR